MKKFLVVLMIGLLMFNVPVVAIDSDSDDDETYVIRVKSNPEGVATFSGTMEGLVEGQGYEILYMIRDDAYEFDSWSGGLPMGVFGDEDLELVANFKLIEKDDELTVEDAKLSDEDTELTEEDDELVEEIFEEEETPESPSVVVGGKNSGIEGGIILDDLLDDEASEALDDERLPEAGGVPGIVMVLCGGSLVILGMTRRRLER